MCYWTACDWYLEYDCNIFFRLHTEKTDSYYHSYCFTRTWSILTKDAISRCKTGTDVKRFIVRISLLVLFYCFPYANLYFMSTSFRAIFRSLVYFDAFSW